MYVVEQEARVSFGTTSAIVGVGETKLGKRPGWSGLELQAEAIIAALADAGLGREDVDGVFNLGPYSQHAQMFAMTMSEYLGIHPTVQGSIDAGGTWSAMLMVANCVWAVESGHCNVAVCSFGEAAATGRPVAGRGWTTTAELPEFEYPFGVTGAVVPYALLTSRHMAEFGTTVEGLGAVAASARRHAALNDNAVRRTPFTMEEYLASRMISTPLRLLDCSTIVDGAGAIVVTTQDRARDLRQRPVTVMSVESHLSHRNVGQFTSFDDLRIREVGARALGRAGVGLDDVDVLEVHDAFTMSTLLYIEELGFCRRGEGSEFALGGGLDLGEKCPVNTHGGLLSQGHVGGFLHVVEAVRQLRGECGDRQVAGAEVAMVAGGGGIFGVNAAMLLSQLR
jgi:acetyl-CoA acetyltransferase